MIVADPRAIELVQMPHVEADFHFLQLTPGTNVALFNAMAHVVMIEGLADEKFIAERCDPREFASWRDFIVQERNSPEAAATSHGRPGRSDSRGRAAVRQRSE